MKISKLQSAIVGFIKGRNPSSKNEVKRLHLSLHTPHVTDVFYASNILIVIKRTNDT